MTTVDDSASIGVGSASILSLALLFPALAAAGGAALAGPPVELLFVEATSSHLPVDELLGFSMDARPIDVDGDADLDLVLAVEFRPNILLVNSGSGRFTDESLSRLPQVRRDSEDVGVADFDGDGWDDIVVVSEDDRVNELYLNTGGGVFVDAGERLPVGGRSNAVVVADLDGDGSPDILIGNNGQNVALVNDGQGWFVDETASRLPVIDDVTQDLELGDVDGDDDLDLLVGNEDRNRLLLDQGGGFFVDASDERLPVPDAPEETREADFGDIDGDGDLDVFFANVRLFVPGARLSNRLLVNHGGFFTDETTERLPEDEDVTMDGDFVDVDGDGDLDLLTANFDDLAGRRAAAPYRVYRNDGQGVFEEVTAGVFPGGIVGNGLDIEAADLDGDGAVDLYLASRGGVDRLLLTDVDGDGVAHGGDRCPFRPDPGQEDRDEDGVGDACEPFRRGDVDGDGEQDIGDPVRLLVRLFGGGGELDCRDAADANDDGALDVADAVFSLDYLFVGGAPPPPPGPSPGACGTDPTLDALACASGCD